MARNSIQKPSLSLRAPLGRFFMLIGALSLGGGVTWSCEEPVECLIDSSCEEGLVCVNTQCVGTELEVNAESWKLYKEEMHNRLAADCGICHGVRGALPPAVYGQEPVNPEEAPEKVSVRDLIKLPVQSGDSGWRIYLDNLTDERLFASYLDTLQFVNKDAPERSLLLAFGRGEIKVNGSENADQIIPHPKVYDVPIVGDPEPPNCTLAFKEVEREQPKAPADPAQDPPLPPPSPSQVSHQRLQAWAGLDHSQYGGAWPYTLDSYRAHVEPLVQEYCKACHGAKDDLEANESIRGGFCFPVEANSKADINLWASMINVNDPGASALLHFLNGDFDHAKYTKNNYEEIRDALEPAIQKWIDNER